MKAIAELPAGPTPAHALTCWLGRLNPLPDKAGELQVAAAAENGCAGRQQASEKRL